SFTDTPPTFISTLSLHDALPIFYEVAPYLVRSAHAIAIRPICFSAKSFRALPPELQEAILKAGAEAGAYGRAIEQAEYEARLERSEEHTSELQSRRDLVCRLLLE